MKNRQNEASREFLKLVRYISDELYNNGVKFLPQNGQIGYFLPPEMGFQIEEATDGAVEHGGLPGIWLQPVRRGLGALLHDFHEMLCGPAGSSDPDTPDPIAALEWRPRPVNKQSKMYCA